MFRKSSGQFGSGENLQHAAKDDNKSETSPQTAKANLSIRVSRNKFATAFGFNQTDIQKIEKGEPLSKALAIRP